jgi:inosine/xanthosine triphosphate pyrophosphatase family protein
MTIFVSSNQGKIKEVRSILGRELVSQSMELEEIQSLDFKEIVQHKLMQAYQQVKQPVLVEEHWVTNSSLWFTASWSVY